ncbi:MAG: tetrahydrofolate dehydrogenase/cyclohydrolase catalytic domain-containing protein, partial [Candidatus Kapaibacterium sp.]
MAEPIIIDGKTVSEAIIDRVHAESRALIAERGITPGLAVVLVGDDPASATYVRSKGKMCERLGFHSVTHKLPADTAENDLLALVGRLNVDPAIHGILVQAPLPGHINYDRIVKAIDYRKDVDGLHPVSVGRMVIGMPALESCTPAGVIEMLK